MRTLQISPASASSGIQLGAVQEVNLMAVVVMVVVVVGYEVMVAVMAEGGSNIHHVGNYNRNQIN